ncbi:MAG TPA: FtsX-like permease family protein [Bacteroidota bacterium]|nr:FtsX-like permease family protein [Bacteroidota bacterium]
MLARLALKNLLGAGLRTWLNVLVLSFSFVTIIGTQGLLEGMNDQVAQAMIDTEYGGGQYWHEAYDPYDPLTLGSAHASLSPHLAALIEQGKAEPVLVLQGSLSLRGRVRTILIKGINPDQALLRLPASLLSAGPGTIPAIIGARMARVAGISEGDEVTLQWRDARGTFDARDVMVTGVFTTSVQSVDNNQIWIPLDTLRNLARMEGEATLVVVASGANTPAAGRGWHFKDLEYLLSDIREVVRSKTSASSLVYVILLLLAMLAIFDTQVLSVWRRRREIGTLMALGMTRTQVIQLFTLEGAAHGVLAALLAALYGIPLLGTLARNGWELPAVTESYGFAIGERLFPVYTYALVAGTTLLVLLVTAIVSFIPVRRIAQLKPTDALRGKFS